eukprot:scaffold35633_cov56-Phaeocystis_antarctica.AAC.2
MLRHSTYRRSGLAPGPPAPLDALARAAHPDGTGYSREPPLHLLVRSRRLVVILPPSAQDRAKHAPVCAHPPLHLGHQRLPALAGDQGGRALPDALEERDVAVDQHALHDLQHGVLVFPLRVPALAARVGIVPTVCLEAALVAFGGSHAR